MTTEKISPTIKIYDPEYTRPLYSRDYLETIAGQQLLKKIHKYNREVKRNKAIKIRCMCGSKYILMSIRCSDNGRKYYLATYPKKAQYHMENCENNKPKVSKPKPSKRKDDTELQSDDIILYSKEDITKEKLVQLNSYSFFDNPINKDPQVTAHYDEQSKPEKKKKYSSLYTRGELLLSAAWHNCLIKYNRIPKEGNIFHYLYTNLEKHFVNPKTSFSQIMFNAYEIRSLKEKETHIDDLAYRAYYIIHNRAAENKLPNCKMYVLLKLGAIEEIEENKLKFELIEPIRKSKFWVCAKKDYFESKFKQYKIGDSEEVEYFVSAEIFASDDKLTVHRMAFIPVFKGRALFMESTKEIIFTKMLLKYNVFFLRPSQSDKKTARKWNGKIPDFLILDPITKEMKAIAEVFGYYTDDYENAAKEKIAFFNEYNELTGIDFMYWMAFKNYEIPKWKIKKYSHKAD